MKKYPKAKNNSLFIYVLILLKRLPNAKIKMAMLNAVQTVIEEYQDNVDLTLIGFSENFITLKIQNCLIYPLPPKTDAGKYPCSPGIKSIHEMNPSRA